MNCTRCGKEIPEGENKLCEDCQKSLLSELNEEVENAEVKETSKNSAKKEKKEGKKSKKGLIIGIIIIVLIIATIVVVQLKTCFFSNLFKKVNTEGNTIGNIRNYGYATTEKGWIYYITPNEDSSSITVNKALENGKEKQKIYETDRDIISLNAVDGYLYFITIGTLTETDTEENLTDNESVDLDYIDNKICKMKKDGSDFEVINDNNFSNDCYEIYVINDRVYYIGEDYNIYSMKTDGTDVKQLNKNKTGFLGINENYILFNDYPEGVSDEDEDAKYITYIMDLNGENVRPVNGERLYSVAIFGDYIYFTDEDKNICKIKVDGTDRQNILETSAYNMNLSGNYIYYMNYKNEEESDYTVCIYRVSVNGGEPEMLKELNTYSSFLDVVNDKVYYMDSVDNNGVINLLNSKTKDEVNIYTVSYNSISSEEENDEVEVEENQEVKE